MPEFSYQARTADGELKAGRLDAPNADAVAGQLLGSGLTPIRIELRPAGQEALAQLRQLLAAGRRIRIDDVILFCRQMQTLVSAGVPLIRALRGLAETVRNPTMAQALLAVIDDLEGGRELSTALARHPLVFPHILCSMVQVGEATGRLGEAFQQTSRYLELEKETASRVKSALRYPTFVILAISVALIFVTLFVIPAFAKIYHGFNAQLPWATRFLIGLSDFALAWWPLVLVGGIALFWSGRRYLRTDAGRFAWGRFKLKLPLVGDIILRATMSRFARAFAMTYGAGVPMIHALNVTAQAVDNPFVGSRIEQMGVGIQRGDTLTRTAAQTRLLTPLVLQMLAVGEETGAVDTMLQDVAEYYEREVDYDLRSLTSTIEPILIIAIGGMVLVLALGVFLPMWNLAGAARGG
jgi:MSHA biogenesis protein MshG